MKCTVCGSPAVCQTRDCPGRGLISDRPIDAVSLRQAASYAVTTPHQTEDYTTAEANSKFWRLNRTIVLSSSLFVAVTLALKLRRMKKKNGGRRNNNYLNWRARPIVLLFKFVKQNSSLCFYWCFVYIFIYSIYTSLSHRTDTHLSLQIFPHLTTKLLKFRVYIFRISLTVALSSPTFKSFSSLWTC